MSTATRRLDEIIGVLGVLARGGYTQKQIGAVSALFWRLDQQLGQLLMPKLEVGAYFDVFETALMTLSTASAKL